METAPITEREGVVSRLTRGIRRLMGSVRFLMIASGVAFIVVVNMFIAYGVWQQREDALVRLADSTDALTAMVAARAERALDEVDRLDRELMERGFTETPHPTGRDADSPGSDGAARPWPIQRRLDDAAVIPGIRGVAILAADGERVHQAGDPPSSAPPPNGAKDGVTTIVRPLRGPGSGGGGGELGTLLVRIDAMYLLGRTPDAAAKAGIEVALRSDAAATTGGGASEVSPALRMGGRFISRARVPGRPHTVTVSQEIDPALADWRRDGLAWSAIGLAMSVAIGVLTWFVVRQLERREAAQAEALEASRRIRRVLDSMVDAVITIDGRGRILTFNPAAEQMFGFGEEEITGRSINLLVPRDSHEHHHRIDPTNRSDGPLIIGVDREATALRRDGSSFPMTLAISALTEDTGSGEAPAALDDRMYVGVVRDITQRKRFEAEIMAAKNQAESANRIKTEFLANMSHELRTPLNAIIGFSEILESQYFGKMNDRQISCAKDIHDSGRHLLDIVNAVLDMSRIETGHFELTEEMADVGDIVAQALALVRDRADECGLTLVNDARMALPRIWVDPRAYKRAILNLLSNAVKFTPSGGTVTVTSALDGDGGLRVLVSDTGIGIAAESMELIFEPFRQGEGSSNRSYEGTGLGLTIARNLMELHGGTLTCESVVDEGTTMTARLPPDRVYGEGRLSPPVARPSDSSASSNG